VPADAHKKVVLEDSAAHLVITDSSSTIPAVEITVLIAAEILASSSAPAAHSGITALPNPDNCFTNGIFGSNLMAIMYTSGSTGRPKGVCLEHAAVVASMALEPWAGVCDADVFAQCSSCGFPGSLHDCWLPLVRGASMVIIPREVLLEPAAFAATVAQHGITSAFLTPRVLELYADSAPASLDGLKRVWVAGEAVRPDAMALLAARPSRTQLWNLYGCTEHCGCISGFKVTPDNAQALASAERCPIGSPTSGVTVVLLDADRCVITQPGVQGEIWIAGPQLSSGYHNLSAVTSERFVLLPQLAAQGQQPSRFYRTGDLGMWRLPPGGSSNDSDLVLDHMGRAQGVDSMVKVNGYQVCMTACGHGLKVVL
jgi:non-ribosomal peptide synthetase component F